MTSQDFVDCRSQILLPPWVTCQITIYYQSRWWVRAGKTNRFFYDELLSTAGHFDSAIHFIPIHVLHESVDVFRGSRAVIHMIRVFVHIEY